MSRLERAKQRLLFGVGASLYDAITGHEIWMQQVASALEHAPWVDPEAAVLDLGCGPGVSAFALAHALDAAQVLGVDLSPEMIARAEHHRHASPVADRVRFECADATDLTNVETASVDLVFGHSFLYLVADPARVLGEVRRTLRPGGTLLLMEPRREGSLVGAVSEQRRSASTAASTDAGWSVRMRFATSMLLWRVVSGVVGQLDGDWLRTHITGADLVDVRLSPTLGGLGWHVVARRALDDAELE